MGSTFSGFIRIVFYRKSLEILEIFDQFEKIDQVAAFTITLI